MRAALLSLSAVALFLALTTMPQRLQAQFAPTPTPVPVTHVDFSSMVFLTGTWSCTQLVRKKLRPDTSFTTLGMDGTWLVTQDTAPPFDQYRTFAIHGTSYVSYDQSIKKWVSIGVDSVGNYYLSSSDGWQGNTLTWTEKDLDGSTATDAITKLSDTETTESFTRTEPNGKTTTVAFHCKKAGG